MPTLTIREAVVTMATSKSKTPKLTAIERALAAAENATKLRTPESFAAAVIALTNLPADKLDAKLHAFIREHGQHVLTAPGQARDAITAAEQAANAARKALETATGTLTTARKGEAQRTREAEVFCHRVIDVHRIMSQAEFVKTFGISQGQVSRYQLAGRGMAVTGRTSDKAAVDMYSLAGNQRAALSAALKVKDPGKREQAVVGLLDGADKAKADAKAKAAADKAKAKADEQAKAAADAEPLHVQAERHAEQLIADLVILTKGDQPVDAKVWRALMSAVVAHGRKFYPDAGRTATPSPVAPVKALPVPNSERKAS